MKSFLFSDVSNDAFMMLHDFIEADFWVVREHGNVGEVSHVPELKIGGLVCAGIFVNRVTILFFIG